jgi:hypothetical protein
MYIQIINPYFGYYEMTQQIMGLEVEKIRIYLNELISKRKKRLQVESFDQVEINVNNLIEFLEKNFIFRIKSK